jgi:SynChlorMet cassette protein ScmC
MPRSLADNTYVLSLTRHFAWNLSATKGADAWLKSFASVLGLQRGSRCGSPRITFIRGAGAGPPFTEPPWPPDSGELKRLGREGWKTDDLTLVSFWTPPQGSDLVCELLNSHARKIAVLMMGEALHPVYHKAIEAGGMPLHGALVELNGQGVVLAGANDAGKTTCCRRLPDPWKVLCDDEILIVKEAGNGYRAHPFPTWSDYFLSRSRESCDVSRSVPLSAIFFLQQAPSIEILPMGRGQAAARINESAGQACFWRLKALELALRRVWTTKLFDNTCDLAGNVPAFLLRLNLTGRFWEDIERVLAVLPKASPAPSSLIAHRRVPERS